MVEEEVPKDLITAGERNFTFKVEGKEDGVGYFATAGRDAQNAVIVIQEWWGLNKHLCETTEQFGQQGFAALAVDMYRGKSADSRESAGHLYHGLDFAGAI